MAVFKSKKTYIKRYASKNFDKKITFSDNVKATFASSQKLTIPISLSLFKKTNEKKVVYKPVKKKKENLVSDIGKNETMPSPKEVALEKEKVLAFVGSVAREELSKELSSLPETELTEVVSEPESAAESEAEAMSEVAPRSYEISEHKPETDVQSEEKTESEKEEKPKKAKKEKKIKEKKTKEKKVKEKKVKEKKEKKEKEKKEKKPRKKISKKLLGKIIFLVLILIACGYLGYEFMETKIEEYKALQQELSVSYAPEDYIYPEASAQILDKNKAARDEAYRIAMQNAYVPASGEVKGLYTYDYVKTCYLTFDDGPSGPVTEQILDTLKEYDVPATFFVVGKNVLQFPDQIKRMVSEGHSIGNHSFSHDYGYMYEGDPQFDSEMHGCKNAIDSVLGEEYKNLLYRFPGGSFEIYKSFYIYNIQSEGYQYVDWNALTGDAEQQSPDKEYIMKSLKESTLDGTKEDIVVLLHDASAKGITADTLPDVIEYLKSKNYVFKAIKNSNYNS